MSLQRADAYHLDFFDIDDDPCPYCGAMNGIDTVGYCPHVLSLSVEDEIVYVSDDFVQVADAVFGLPDLLKTKEQKKAFLTESRHIPTKRAGLMRPAELVRAVEQAVLEAGCELTVGDAQAIKPYHAVFIETPFEGAFPEGVESVYDRARNLWPSMYLDDAWYLSADRDKPDFADFYMKAHDMHEQAKTMTQPLQAMLFYVNKKKSLCLRYGQCYVNPLDGFAEFEMDNYEHSLTYLPVDEKKAD